MRDECGMQEKGARVEGHWDTGTLGHWDAGILGYWDTGTLGHWDTGILGQGIKGRGLTELQTTADPVSMGERGGRACSIVCGAIVQRGLSSQLAPSRVSRPDFGRATLKTEYKREARSLTYCHNPAPSHGSYPKEATSDK